MAYFRWCRYAQPPATVLASLWLAEYVPHKLEIENIRSTRNQASALSGLNDGHPSIFNAIASDVALPNKMTAP